MTRVANLWLAAALIVPAVSAAPPTLWDGFRDPPRSQSLAPYWFWKGRINAPETRRQIKEMMAQGVYQAIVFPWDGMEIRYLSEEYWREIGAALDIAAELGFTLNIADEYDWPSGHAWDPHSRRPELSTVLDRHPEFRMRRLEETEHPLAAGATWRLEPGARPEAVLAARFDAQGRLDAASLTPVETGEFRTPPGLWRVFVYTAIPAVGSHNTRVDLLNPAAVRAYIDLVYEEYARRFPQHLGKTLKLTVADHEGAYGSAIAWTPGLRDRFRARAGRDLYRELPLLTHVTADPSRGRTARQDYLRVVSDLYVESFTGQVTDWCRRHGLLHGASFYEEQLHIQVSDGGDMFEQWRATSVVEIDALIERARMPIDFKEAVTVAHFDRKPLVVENQGLQGHDSFFSLEKARLGTNMCVLWGANLLVPYFDYDPRKVTYPPEWFFSQPFRRYFRRYADYVRRATYLSSRGRHVAPVALYYPLESAFAHAESLLNRRLRRGLRWNNAMDHTQNFYSALQLELARAGWDYHIFDARYLREAEVRDGALEIAGERFRVMILPPMTELAPSSLAQLRRFAAAGGVVWTVGEAPGGFRSFAVREHPPAMDTLDYTRPVVVPDGIRRDLQPLLEALRGVVPPEVDFGSDHKNFYASHRTEEGVDWYWVVNDSGDARRARWRFAGAGKYEKWDAETGERSPLCLDGGRVALEFGPWDAFAVVRTGGVTPDCSAAEPERVLLRLPDGGWRFTAESGPVLVPYANLEGEAEPVWLQPERLSNRGWWLTGPYPFDDHYGFFRKHPPEENLETAGGPVNWTWYESPSYKVTIRDALPEGRLLGVYYAQVHVYSPKPRRATALASFADSLELWWNGERKLQEHRHQKFSLIRDPWAERVPVEVRAGWNHLLLKIEAGTESPAAFLFRIVDATGATLRDLVYSKDRSLAPPAARKVRLTVPAPPWASPLSIGTDTARLPEKPFAFAARNVPFRLESWTDSALAHYSGVARYETTFELEELPAGRRILLDLGGVGVAAEVWVNGSKCGERAWRPFRFDITAAAKRGRNRLLVRVANSSAGWMAQGDPIYTPGSWGLRFRTERDRLPAIRPNGLEGPVSVVAVAPR